MSIMSTTQEDTTPRSLPVVAWGQKGAGFERTSHHPSTVMRASLQKIANRLSHLEHLESDREATGAFLAFAEETDDAFEASFAPEITLRGTFRAIGTLLFIVEPECGTAFLARHIAAALAAQNFVAVSVLREQPSDMSRMLATLEDVVPESFATISRNGTENWTKVPRDSHTAILTPQAVFFDGMPQVTFDDAATDHASRRALISTYSTLDLHETPA